MTELSYTSREEFYDFGPHRRSSVEEQLRVAELVQAAQALRETLKEKEKEMEGTAKEARKQHADNLR